MLSRLWGSRLKNSKTLHTRTQFHVKMPSGKSGRRIKAIWKVWERGIQSNWESAWNVRVRVWNRNQRQLQISPICSQEGLEEEFKESLEKRAQAIGSQPDEFARGSRRGV